MRGTGYANCSTDSKATWSGPWALLLILRPLVFLAALVPVAGHAVTDSVLCRLPYAPGVPADSGTGASKPRLVLIEGVSRQRPHVSFYGHQIQELAKVKEEGTGAWYLDGPDSRYLFKLDEARMRLSVALKTQENAGGKSPLPGQGVAGNCSPL